MTLNWIFYILRGSDKKSKWSVSPGVNLQFDAKGKLLGVEILNASSLMKGVIEPLRAKALAA